MQAGTNAEIRLLLTEYLFLQKLQPTQNATDGLEFKEVVSYVKTLAAKGGKPVPVDEKGIEALIETKYKL